VKGGGHTNKRKNTVKKNKKEKIIKRKIKIK
jgi:hypothetical protein